MNKLIVTLISASLMMLISGCASEPTLGDAMIEQGPVSAELGKQWNEGNQMVIKGEKLVKKGKEQIEDGEDEIKKGNKLIRKGNRRMDDGRENIARGENMIREGKDIVRRSEQRYQQNKNLQ